MPTLNERNFSGVPGLNLRSANGCLRFETPTITPTITTGERLLYCNASNQLIFNDGSSTTILGSSGSVVSYSLNDAYDDGAAITVDAAAVTFAGSHATNNVFAVTLTGSGTGNMIDIDNSTSGTAGFDIEGTGDTWSVSAAGAAIFTTITGCTALTSSGNLALDATGTGTIAIGGTSTGDVTIGAGGGDLVATTAVVITGSADTDVLTITDGDVLMSNGLLQITSDDVATGSIVCVSAITTGSVIHLTADDLDEGYGIFIDSDNGANFGVGGYFACYDGSDVQMLIARYGAITIAGNAAGTDAITMTAGDLTLSEGFVSVTTTATTAANVIDVVATGLTTKNIFHCDDADGLTTGSMLYLVSDSTDTTARPLAYVKNDNTAAVAAVCLSLANDSTSDDIQIDHNGITGTSISVDSEVTTDTGGIIDIAPTVLTSGTVIDIGDVNAITTGIVLNVASTSAVATSADFIKIAHTASSATLTARTGSAIDIASSLTNTKTSATLAHDYDLVTISRVDVQNGAAGTTTSAGSALKVLHTATQTAGTLTDTAYAIEVQTTGTGTSASLFINSDNATGGSILVDDETLTGIVFDLSLQVLTTGKAIDISDLDAITSGKALHIDATGNTQTTGILVHIDSGSSVIAGAGRLFLSAHTGTAGTTAVLNEFASASTADETVLRVTASAALAGGTVLDISAAALTTGTLIDMTGLAGLTTGKAIHIDANGVTQTDGILVHIDSASTALTSTGRLLLVDHTGNATVSGIIAEIKSVAADETVLLKLNGAAITSGYLLDLNPTAVTTGSALRIEGADALTTGDLVSLESDSSNTSARALLKMHNNNTAATGTVPLEIVQDAPTSINYKKIADLGGVVLWVGTGTTANGNLSGTAGDICFNGGSNKPEFCSGTTSWSALV